MFFSLLLQLKTQPAGALTISGANLVKKLKKRIKKDLKSQPIQQNSLKFVHTRILSGQIQKPRQELTGNSHLKAEDSNITKLTAKLRADLLLFHSLKSLPTARIHFTIVFCHLQCKYRER